MTMTADLASKAKYAFEAHKEELAKWAPLDQWQPAIEVDRGAYRIVAKHDKHDPVVLVPWTRLGREVI